MQEIISIIDSDTRPFWDGTIENQLMIQHCPSCRVYQFYPRIVCKNCLKDVNWVQASGRGTIYSFTVVERTFNTAFKDKVPYIVALIELEEGPRMLTNIIGANIEKIEIGLPVKAAFNEPYGDYKLLQFHLDM